MVDLSKVSEAVRKFVAETAKLDGSKKEIDTRQEYAKLSEYLSGNQENMSTHEKEFIQGFMIEYETKTKKQELEAEKKKIEESTTDNVKESVKKIAKRLSNKKKIDADEEAQALALMLRNTKGDLNKADIEYIKNILIENGYESYIPKEQEPVETTPKEPPQPEEKSPQDATKGNSSPEPAPAQGGNTPRETAKPAPAQEGESPKDTPRTDIAPKNPGKTKPKSKIRPDKPEPDKKVDPEKTQPDQKQPESNIAPEMQPDQPQEPTTTNKPLPHVTEGGRNKGLKLANTVIDEINSNYADNKKIKANLRSVDGTSAHTFIGQFANKGNGGLNQDIFSISDLFNKIDYSDTLHVMKKLLIQAKSMGLESNPAYKALESEIKYGEEAFARKTEVDPEKSTQRKADGIVNWLYNEMSRAMARAGN